ncbi:hypothetical protein CP97_14841 [Aurantiacibacter atlanticus]|uniref:Uncharacterized protein n=1 Tax=Aurantiacibacter atlanticus TaxID=1648404 RepID=A0A168M3D3_9SPHN|nr:hypothetical protein CP97_14841 [Aurantiacibacter atlanticus]
MLNHIEAGRFLEHPARKYANPLKIGIDIGPFIDIDLHEGARLLRLFPGCCPLACGQADDDIVHAPRFARHHLDFAADLVALVDKADGGHPLLHRSADHLGIVRCDLRCRFTLQFFGDIGFFGLPFGRGFIASGQGQHACCKKHTGAGGAPPAHASGVQAS